MHNLHVAITPYSPTVECGPIHSRCPPPAACQAVLDSMPVSNGRRVFGRRDTPGVDAELPRIFLGRKSLPNHSVITYLGQPRSNQSLTRSKAAGRCTVIVTTTGMPDDSAWYENVACCGSS